MEKNMIKGGLAGLVLLLSAAGSQGLGGIPFRGDAGITQNPSLVSTYLKTEPSEISHYGSIVRKSPFFADSSLVDSFKYV